MLEYLKERGGFLAILVIIVGFFAFAIISNPTSKTSSVFNTADTTSPMGMGNPDSKLSLIQYSDFLCPSCSYFSSQVMPLIKEKYIDTDKIAFEFRPMSFIAEGSVIADQGAYCAIDQSKFWEYHDAVYTYVWDNAFSKNVNPKTTTVLTNPLVKQIASSVELNSDEFDECLDSNKYYQDVVDATSLANSNGVTGTPYILINGQRYQGDISFDAIDKVIKSQL